MGDHAPRGRGLTKERAVAAPGPSVLEIFPARSLGPDMIEAGRRLFTHRTDFICGAAEPSAFPREILPEVAFAGRSNVGKSSLINALTGRRMLARTSKTPGRTRQINFFDLDGRLMLVDLPGYGYAEASKSEVRRWTDLLRRYLQTRAALRRVCLLVDTRHGLKEADRPMMQLLDDWGVSYQIVLTKIDKLRASELAETAGHVAGELAAHPAVHPEIHLTSAIEQRGIAALRATLSGFAPPAAGPSVMAVPARPDRTSGSDQPAASASR
jgi:GTP-binding protein